MDTLDQLDRALECDPDIILVDNLGPDALAEAVRRRDAGNPRRPAGGLRRDHPGDGRRPAPRPGSTGSASARLTHSAPALDIGLDFDRSTSAVNIPLLDRLRAAGGAFVPLAELGANLDRLRRDLDELEAFGFAIERHPYLGAAYRGPAGRLCPDQIEYELGTRRVGRRVAVWNRVTSTNDLAARAAASTANDGLVVLAEEQTAGRGRRGRTWVGPARVVGPDVGPALPARAAWTTAGLADRPGGRGGGRGRRPSGRAARPGSSGRTTSGSTGASSRASSSSRPRRGDRDRRERQPRRRRVPRRPPPHRPPRSSSSPGRRSTARSSPATWSGDWTGGTGAALDGGSGLLSRPGAGLSEHLGRDVRVGTPAGVVSGRLSALDLETRDDPHDARRRGAGSSDSSGHRA